MIGNIYVMPYVFTFELFLEVKPLILDSWNSATNLPVWLWLSRCRHAISSWSKKQFANSKLQIESLKAEVEAAMADTAGDDTLIAWLNLELLRAYKDEEDFWRQRRRLMCLAAEDKNSGFFSRSLQRETGQELNCYYRKCWGKCTVWGSSYSTWDNHFLPVYLHCKFWSKPPIRAKDCSWSSNLIV